MTYLAVEKCIQALNSSNLELALYFQVLINDTQSVIFFR